MANHCCEDWTYRGVPCPCDKAPEAGAAQMYECDFCGYVGNAPDHLKRGTLYVCQRVVAPWRSGETQG